MAKRTRPKTKPKPRPRDAQATQALLLATAGDAFSARGYDGARVDEIAERARVNKRMIYAYFGDKDGLYLAVLDTHLAQAVALAKVTGLDPAASPRAEVETFIRRFFEYMDAHPDFARLLSWEALSGERRGREILVERVRALFLPLHAVLRRGVERGELRAGLDPHFFAAALTALLVGFENHRSFLESLWQTDLSAPEARARVLDGIVHLLFDGIGAPHP